MSASSPKSLSSIDGTWGWKAPGSQVDLKDIIQELQGLRISYVDGGAQSTALSLKTKGGATGSAAKALTSDVLLAAVQFRLVAASGLVDVSLRNDARIVSTGNVQFSGGTQNTSRFLIFWWDQSGYVANA